MSNKDFESKVLTKLWVLDTLVDKVELLDWKVTNLQTDVTELKTDVTELKTDVTELKTNVTNLQTDVTNLKEKTDNMDSKIFIMDKKIDRIDDKIDNRSDELEQSIRLNSQYINQSFQKNYRITTLKRTFISSFFDKVKTFYNIEFICYKIVEI